MNRRTAAPLPNRRSERNEVKTLEQVLEAIRGGRESQCIDGRDYSRLTEFVPVETWDVLGFSLKEGATASSPRPWTEEEIRAQLASDLEFGFEKALNKRGLSAGSMHSVVKMWMWILDDPLEHHNGYAQYGLPFFKAVALKYGLPNPIGNDSGSEGKYAEE